LRGAYRSKAEERQARLAGTRQKARRKRGGEHERFERSDHKRFERSDHERQTRLAGTRQKAPRKRGGELERFERSDHERQARLVGTRQQAPRKRGGEPGRFGRQNGLSLKVHDTAALQVAFSAGPKKNAPSTLGRTLQAVSAAAWRVFLVSADPVTIYNNFQNSEKCAKSGTKKTTFSGSNGGMETWGKARDEGRGSRGKRQRRWSRGEGRRAFSGKPKATAGVGGRHGWASQPWHTGMGVDGRSNG
jgi:hypothetical protein